MANMSDYLEVEMRKHIFRTGSFTKPTNLYVCLVTTLATDASTGSTIVEPTTGGYTRQALNPSDSNWTAASSTNGLTDNASAISFTASGGNFGTIVGIAICDASTNGNMLIHAPLSSSKLIEDGDTLTIPIGALDITFA